MTDLEAENKRLRAEVARLETALSRVNTMARHKWRSTGKKTGRQKCLQCGVIRVKDPSGKYRYLHPEPDDEGYFLSPPCKYRTAR